MERAWPHHMRLADHVDALARLAGSGEEPGVIVMAVEGYLNAQDPSQRQLGRALSLIEQGFDADDWARFDAGPGAVVGAAHARLDEALRGLEATDPLASRLVAEMARDLLGGR